MPFVLGGGEGKRGNSFPVAVGVDKWFASGGQPKGRVSRLPNRRMQGLKISGPSFADV